MGHPVIGAVLRKYFGQDHVPLEAEDAAVRVAAHEDSQESGAGVKVDDLFEAESLVASSVL